MSDAIGLERRDFFARLLRNPLFALRHAPALSCAVYRKLNNRIRLKFASGQRGLKRHPGWMPPPPSEMPDGIGEVWADDLPAYPAIDASPAQATPAEAGDPGDPEIYLLAQRWRFLLEAALGKRSDDGMSRVREWIREHRDREAPEWETYSACERVANLLLFLSVRRPPLEKGLEAELGAFIRDSLRWIESQLEYYGESATNNHLINNGRVLVMGGVALRDARTVAAGMAVLRHVLPRMVLPGGFLRERSSHYQLVVTGWILDAYHFASHVAPGSDDARLLGDVASRMAHACSMLRDERGMLLACIGDVSPDAPPALSAAKLLRLYPDSRVYPTGSQRTVDGWFRLSSGEATVLGNFPAGEHPLSFPTHGHADHGSFVWLQGGMHVLDDPGRFGYSADARSQWQRGAAAHNTLLVDGRPPLCGSLLAAGEWWPRPYARAHLALEPVERGVTLRHDGFARATPVRGHARTISLEGATLTVTDVLDGAGPARLRFGWLFGEAFTKFEPQTMRAFASDARVTISVEGATNAQVTSARGEDGAGWTSPEYNRAAPALSVGLEYTLTLPARVITRFSYEPCAE
jgi:hypothetical protein